MLVYDKIGATYAVTLQTSIPSSGRACQILAQPGHDVLRPGLDRLAADLDSGARHRRHYDLRNRADFDGGYRLLTAELGAPNAKGGAR